ncbi:hypothetical protein ACFLU5_13535 [Bacteroidota bacterium]
MKKAHRISIFISLILTSPVSGQSLEFYNRFEIPSYTSLSIDRGDFLFIAESSGSIQKYDWDGNLVLTFSSGRIAPVTNLEARMTNKIFVFYNDLQQYLVLDRFMTSISDLHLPPDLIGYAHIATLAPDNNVWIIDDNDFSLKKFSPQYSEVLLITPFDLLLDNDNYAIEDMTEYQNRLYISDKYKGILVFDNMGNYLDTKPYMGIDELSFYRDYLLVSHFDTLQFIDLYRFEKKQFKIEDLSDWEQVVCGGEYIYFLKGGDAFVYRIDH